LQSSSVSREPSPRASLPSRDPQALLLLSNRYQGGFRIGVSLAFEGIGATLSRAKYGIKFALAHLSIVKVACLTLLLSPFLTFPLHAQTSPEERQPDDVPSSSSKPQSVAQSANDLAGSETPADHGVVRQNSSPPEYKQPKRILWVIPNYRAVSTTSLLPPLSPKQKVWLATQDSFDYSSFFLAAIVAGVSQGENSTPEFGHGGTAYGRYLWHTFTDEAVGNYFTEALLPLATKEDPRYYTLGRSGGGFLRRTGYSLTRLLITRNDAGHNTFNSSEVLGNLAGAALSDLYYPRPERTLGQNRRKVVPPTGA
jgi:hypothetical protein